MEDLRIGALLGGIGLFLLGMTMMTDGLKLSLGPSIGTLLQRWTATRTRGLFFGIFATALVQSSSAISVAVIGFVNAGLLPLSHSLWVLFGSNVGTTFTGWLVAVIGFKVKLELAALPLVGIGVLLRLSGQETRRGAIGGAIAGFGVLFLGIGFLQQAFPTSTGSLDLAEFSGHGFWSVLAFVLIGAVLTILMQASAAVLAVVLTLAEAGILPLSEAAAVVIGANIGTTTTALLATIGGTPNAKRAALAHVLFNLTTAVVALLLLPMLLQAVAYVRDTMELGSQPAISLALFHTVFNLLGVLLMWPLTERLGRFLETRFHTQEETLGRPRYIDRSVGKVPSLAVNALHREITRLGNLVIEATRAQCLASSPLPSSAQASAFQPLSRAILDFVNEVHRHPMAQDTAENLAALLRVHRYYDSCHDMLPELINLQERLQKLPLPELAASLQTLADCAARNLAHLDRSAEAPSRSETLDLEAFESAYQAQKAALLAAGAAGTLDIDLMDEVMNDFSALRRIVEQAHKAAKMLDSLTPVPMPQPVDLSDTA